MENIIPEDSISQQPVIDEKKELEISKLKEEISEIKKKWYKKPQNIIGLLPALIALLSVGFLYKNGTFDIQTKQLKLTRDQLQYDIAKFQDSIVKYTIEKKQIITETNDLRDSLQNTRKNLSTIELNNTLMKKEVDSLKIRIATSNNQQDKQKDLKKIYAILENYIKKNNQLQLKLIELEKLKAIIAPATSESIKTLENENMKPINQNILFMGGGTQPGAFVFNIEMDWAEKSGIRIADIIIKIGNVKIITQKDYWLAIEKFKRGESVKIVVIRNDKEVILDAKL
jgi:PDZ domain